SIAGVTAAATVSLTGSGAGSVAGGTTVGSFTGIETLVGDNSAHVLSGGSSWTINAANSGTVDGYNFSNFANLTGTAGNDTFTIVNDGGTTTSGSVSGTIAGGGQALGGADTLSIAGVTAAATVSLTGSGAGSVAGG